jgi:hypothetical protein
MIRQVRKLLKPDRPLPASRAGRPSDGVSMRPQLGAGQVLSICRQQRQRFRCSQVLSTSEFSCRYSRVPKRQEHLDSERRRGPPPNLAKSHILLPSSCAGQQNESSAEVNPRAWLLTQRTTAERMTLHSYPRPPAAPRPFILKDNLEMWKSKSPIYFLRNLYSILCWPSRRNRLFIINGWCYTNEGEALQQAFRLVRMLEAHRPCGCS